ncbi:MAG: antibiotic biosynthesis monooxygenase [Pseudomonadota bacterium]
MICRVWRGWTTPENAEVYQSLLKGEIMPGIRSRDIPGLLAHQALRRDIVMSDGHVEVEHMTLMWFRTLDDVQGFVGPNYQQANMPDAAAAVLSRWDKTVAHYEVFDNPDDVVDAL